MSAQYPNPKSSVNDKGLSISPPLNDNQWPKGFQPSSPCVGSQRLVNVQTARLKEILLSFSPIWTIHDGLHSVFQLQICLLLSAGCLAKSISLLEQVRADWDRHSLQRADFVQFSFHLWQTFLHATLQNNCCGICEQPGAFRYPNLLYGSFCDEQGQNSRLGWHPASSDERQPCVLCHLGGMCERVCQKTFG